jgi:hypothetical protein
MQDAVYLTRRRGGRGGIRHFLLYFTLPTSRFLLRPTESRSVYFW